MLHDGNPLSLHIPCLFSPFFQLGSTKGSHTNVLFVRVLRVFPANPEGAVRVLTAAANPSIPDARGLMLPRRRVAMAWVGDREAGCCPRSSAPQAGLEASNIVDGADERARGLVSSTSRPMVGNLGA